MGQHRYLLFVLCSVFSASWAFRPQLQPMTEEYKQFLAEHGSKHRFYKQEISSSLPVEFDGRTAWPGCIHPPQDQGHCGSCWAFAV